MPGSTAAMPYETRRAVVARPRLSAHASSASTIAAAASFSPGALPAVMVPFGRKAGLSRASVSSVVSGPIVLVLVELCRSLLARHFNRHDLRLEMTGGLRAREPLLRAQRPAVLGLAGDLIFLDQIFRVPAGVSVRERVVQPVAQHAVIELAVAQAVAPAAARDEIRRKIHVLHAARHRDLDVAQQDLLRRRDDGLRARAANAIDGHRRRRHRQPRMHGGLPGRIYLGAGLHDIAHDDRFNLVGAKPGALDRGADRHRAEIGSRHVLEAAAKRADRGANGFCENDGALRCHGKPPPESQCQLLMPRLRDAVL